MAGRIRDESIAELREATDVVALVGEYVTLRPGGGTRMKGLCPFHQEKTPSFTVDSSRGLWHCFGCSQGGDAIDFLMKQETLSFTEAVERLAHRAGIEVRYEGRAAGERGAWGARAGWLWAHAQAVEFYHRAGGVAGRAGRAGVPVVAGGRSGGGRAVPARVGARAGVGRAGRAPPRQGVPARGADRGRAGPDRQPGAAGRLPRPGAVPIFDVAGDRSPSGGARWTSTRAAGPSTSTPPRPRSGTRAGRCTR